MIMMRLFKMSKFKYLLHYGKFVIEHIFSGNTFVRKVLGLPWQQKKNIWNELISLIKNSVNHVLQISMLQTIMLKSPFWIKLLCF